MSAPRPKVDIFWSYQWREHVCDVDWDSPIHGGALQSPSPAPEDGRQGDEPSTSLPLYR